MYLYRKSVFIQCKAFIDAIKFTFGMYYEAFKILISAEFPARLRFGEQSERDGWLVFCNVLKNFLSVEFVFSTIHS